MPLMVAFRRQRQMDLPKPKANLVYIRSSNPTKLYSESLSPHMYFKTGDVAQRQSTCLTCTRPGVCSPVQRRRNTEERRKRRKRNISQDMDGEPGPVMFKRATVLNWTCRMFGADRHLIQVPSTSYLTRNDILREKQRWETAAGKMISG